jgi:hypothetical protein
MSTKKGEKINAGWQYRVYNYDDKRVLKEPHNWVSRLKIIYDQNGKFHKHPLLSTAKSFYYSTRDLRSSTNSIHKNWQRLPLELFANPTFLSYYVYTQDKVMPFSTYLRNHSREQNQSAINKIVELIHTCWRHGFGDTSYQYHINYGINDEGNAVLFDFGEIQFEKDCIAYNIQNKRWKTQWHHMQMKDEELKLHIEAAFDENITLQKLEDLWCQKRNANNSDDTA